MEKANVIRSNEFYMDLGDTLHILMETTSGTTPDFMLGEATTFDDAPPAPPYLDLIDIVPTRFLAIWNFQENTTGFYLDVAEDPYFTIMVPAYTNIDVGCVDSYSVTGLSADTDYFCRIRAYNDYGTSANSDTANMYTISLLRCLVRNAELDNSLSLAASTVMTISNKVGQVLTVNDLPDYGGFDETGWVAMLIDVDKTTAPDGSGGDYLYRYFCTIDRAAKTITFAAAYSLTQWEVGDSIGFYHPFANYSFVGDQTVNPTIPVDTGWNGSMTNGGCMFRHSDGRFFILYSGFAAGNIGRIGYYSSLDMTTWTEGNSGNYVFDPTTIPNVTSGYLTGSCHPLNDGTGRYYTLMTTVSSINGHGQLRILYFNEDLTTFTWSAALLADTELGQAGGGILEIDGEFHILYMIISSIDVPHRSINAAKAATLEGAYTHYQTIASGDTANTGVSWSSSTDAPTLYEYDGEVFGFFGCTGYYSLGGTKGNRVYSLIRYDRVSGLWTINKNNATIIAPFYYSSMGALYAWANDHSGGYPSFLFNQGEMYMAQSMKGSIYQYTILNINLIS